MISQFLRSRITLITDVRITEVIINTSPTTILPIANRAWLVTIVLVSEKVLRVSTVNTNPNAKKNRPGTP